MAIVRERPVDTGRALRTGALAGLISGVVFAMFEMVATGLMEGMAAFFMPLRMIGGIALGPSALDPQTSLLMAGGAGLLVHMILSMAYGMATALAIGSVPRVAASRAGVLVASSLAGIALWIVNFYVIAPIAGWTWFTMSNPIVQFVAHAFFYGALLGLILDRTLFARGRTSSV